MHFLNLKIYSFSKIGILDFSRKTNSSRVIKGKSQTEKRKPNKQLFHFFKIPPSKNKRKEKGGKKKSRAHIMTIILFNIVVISIKKDIFF